MASRKKLLTSAVALGAAAVMLLGGTFAWQSINQTVVNEGSNLVNPGGRLHDDFDGSNKDVYVENFASNDIYARIRLEEYFKIAMNVRATMQDDDGNTVPKVDDAGNYVYDRVETELIGTAATDESGKVTSTEYVTFTEYDELVNGNTLAACVVEQETTDEEGTTTTTTETSYFTWTMGNADSESIYYMPTFNQNKDSLAADINGGYKFAEGVITDKDIEGGQYNEMMTYTADSEAFGYEIFDADIDTDDEVAAEHLNYIIENGKLIAQIDDGDEYDYDYTGAIVLSDEAKAHEATALNTTKGLISMSKWLELLGEGEYDADTHGNYWVYDTDGWVYWSGAIKEGATTGRLMDGIELTRGMGDGWYYAINVVAQFITAGDLGQKTNTGFYDENGWSDTAKAPTENALKLLNAIGVNTTDAEPSTGGS